MLARKNMTLGPVKHEKVAIFEENERISNVFRILRVRSTKKSEGIMGSKAFASNSVKYITIRRLENMGQTVKIRNLVLGEKMPKICVPIVGKTEREVLEAAQNIMAYSPDIIEWRIDFLPDVLVVENTIKTLSALRETLKDMPLLVTFRTKKEGGEQAVPEEDYIRLYEKIMETGLADAIDVEVFFGENTLETLVRKAHGYRVKVIASNHEFCMTPPEEEIKRRLRLMQRCGADIAKIAVMPERRADVLTLLRATEEVAGEKQTPVITMSMGGQGMVSRILGENFGSCLTFAMVGKASAPGQIPIGQLRTLLEMIHQYS